MGKLDDLIDDIIVREGGDTYTDNPSDSGGPTKFGITLATLADWREDESVTAEDVKNLTEAEARRIYTHRYWLEPKFDQLAPISLPIAEEVLDTGVNMGQGTAAIFLQRVLTVFNNRGRYYDDLKIDGRVGRRTIAALRAYLSYRGKEGECVLLFCLDALQASRYIRLAEGREKDETFVYGQILRRSYERWRAE